LIDNEEDNEEDDGDSRSLTSYFAVALNNSGSLATLTAMRRASSRVSTPAMWANPPKSTHWR